jgi:hypothetical protein
MTFSGMRVLISAQSSDVETRCLLDVMPKRQERSEQSDWIGVRPLEYGFIVFLGPWERNPQEFDIVRTLSRSLMVNMDLSKRLFEIGLCMVESLSNGDIGADQQS